MRWPARSKRTSPDGIGHRRALERHRCFFGGFAPSPFPALRLDFIGVSSYGGGTESAELVFTKELRLDVSGRDVLLVDDILDTGKTLSQVMVKLRKLRPRRMKICVLLDKPSRRVEQVTAHYIGFEIPNHFVVGYGLDYAERYRNLPFVGVLRPEMFQHPDFIPLLSEKKRLLLQGVKTA